MVGAPIPAKQIANPSEEDVEKLHAKYVRHLQRLYKEHNPYPEIKLVIGWCWNSYSIINSGFIKNFDTISKGFSRLRVAEPFPIFLWQLSLAQVNVSSNLHWKLSEGTSHKDLSSERQRHKKVLSPISRLILWIMEVDYERRKEHWSFPMKFTFQKFYFSV